MCGEFTLHSNIFRLSEHFALTASPIIKEFPVSNITSARHAPIIRLSPCGQRTLSMLCWGLVPSWSQDGKGGSNWINIRAEAVTSLPYYSLFCRARCLVPADGFYEWERSADEPKRPHLISLRNGEPFAFAGLWALWTSGAASLETFTIITTEANRLIRPLHDRMPVIIPHDRYIAWLSPDSTTEELLPLFRPYPAEEMQCVPVSETANESPSETPDLRSGRGTIDKERSVSRNQLQ